jgi:hypothetical protein
MAADTDASRCIRLYISAKKLLLRSDLQEEEVVEGEIDEVNLASAF